MSTKKTKPINLVVNIRFILLKLQRSVNKEDNGNYITLLSFLMVFILILNFQDIYSQSFSSITISNIPAVNKSTQYFIDVNNDNKLDIFISGQTSSNAVADLYLNNGDSTFTKIATGFNQLYNTSASWADYNNDSYPDLLLSGVNQSLEKICTIFRNNGDSTFTEISTEIENVAYGTVFWCDFNNDCLPDVFTCGINSTGSKVTKIYQNTGTEFQAISQILTGVSSSAAIPLDYNSDGFTDILYSGSTSGSKTAKLYKNKGDFQFSSVAHPFENIEKGDISAADYDNDGDLDILITGIDNNNNNVTKLYANNSNIYTEVLTADFDSLGISSSTFGDLNNDGYTDIIVAGLNNENNYNTLLYKNNGDNTFSKVTTGISGITSGDIALGDYNTDGKLDILISGTSDAGRITKLYSNDVATSNLAPTPPTIISSTTFHDSVSFSWNSGSDDYTGADGLTYNVKISTSKSSSDILYPMAFETGERINVSNGSQYLNSNVSFYNLPQNKYYWSVQAIDNGYLGSEFAPVDSFTICHNVFLGNDTSLCRYDTLVVKMNKPDHIVNWYSLKYGLLESNSDSLYFEVAEDDNIVVEVSNSLGCIKYDTLGVVALALPEISLGNDTTICKYDGLELTTGTGWKSVEWYNATSFISSLDTLKLNYDTITNIQVIVSNGPGCISYDSIHISIHDLPILDLGSDTSICYLDTIHLIENHSYPSTEWYESDKLLSIINTLDLEITESTEIVCKVIDNNQCNNYDTLLIEQLGLPSFSLGKDTSICIKENWLYSADTSWGNVVWSVNGSSTITNDSLLHTVFKTDTISVYITNKTNCINADTIIINALELPDFTLGNDTSICYNNGLFMSVGTGWKNVDWYTISDGLLESGSWYFNHSILKSETLYAEVTNSNNCINYDTLLITSLPLPSYALGNDTSICYGDSISLITSNLWSQTNWYIQDSGLWASDQSTLTMPVISNMTIYSEVFDMNQCHNNDTIIVSVLTLPDFNIGKDTTICFNQPLTLEVPNTYQTINWYSLNTGNTYLNIDSISFYVNNNDTIIAEVINSSQCIFYDTLVIESQPLPSFTIGSDTVMCPMDTLWLFAGSGWENVQWHNRSNSWLTSDTLSIPIPFIPLKDDSLYVAVTNENGCIAYDSLFLDLLELPIVDAGTDTLICFGTEAFIGNTGIYPENYTFQWLPQYNISQPTVAYTSVTPDTSTHYVLFIGNEYGCINTDTIFIEVNPQNKFNFNSQQSVCIGNSIEIGNSHVVIGSLLPYQYNWIGDSTLSDPAIPNPTVSPQSNTSYVLVITTGQCKPDTLQVNIQVNSLPTIEITESQTIGNDEQMQLFASGGVIYEWNPKNTLDYSNIPDPIVFPDVSTLYTVSITDSLGCVKDTSVMITVANEIFVPTVFTPNDDGINDYFKIYGFGFQFLSLEIYNRYGQSVFETNSVEQASEIGWDGQYNDNPVPNGKYVWYIKGKYFDGKEISFEGKNTGVVTIIR